MAVFYGPRAFAAQRANACLLIAIAFDAMFCVIAVGATAWILALVSGVSF
jgi:hypothetical protein